MNDIKPHFANVTIDFKYLKDLAKTAKAYHVTLELPIVVSPDCAVTNFTVSGTHENVMKFCQKYEHEARMDLAKTNHEHQLRAEVEREGSKRDIPITRDDVTNVRILLNISQDVNDFIRSM